MYRRKSEDISIESTVEDDFLINLVDCPGHASLMKTVIGGASIIDLMILVVDCQKLI
jgi:selenocysteine-specific translation elongation factor